MAKKKGIFSKNSGTLYIVKRYWIPAFAGMTGERLLPWIVIPAKAGIQSVMPGLIEMLRKKFQITP